MYSFEYAGMTYNYTSSYHNLTVNINDLNVGFSADYIKRGESLKTGTSDGSMETTTIFVTRDNNVALLYQGSPPENGGVKLTIYRYHEESSEIHKILVGVVSQVSFRGSEVELVITIENMLEKQIPTGYCSYYCQNDIYDKTCGLKKELYEKKCWVDIGFDGLYIASTNLNEVESGFYTGGMIKMGNCWRGVLLHDKDRILIKYPINENDRQGSFTIYAGCDNLFLTCAKKFNNTDNFTGVPYTEPTDPTRNPTGKGAYGIDSTIISRDSSMFVGKIGG